MRVLHSALAMGLLVASLASLSACSTSGDTAGRVYYGDSYRSYHGGPWGGYHPPVYIIDDEIDDIHAEQLPELGPPDFDMGGMDGGFDSFDF